MSHKSLRPRHLYVITANNSVLRLPYFEESSNFIRLLIRRRKGDVDAHESEFGEVAETKKLKKVVEGDVRRRRKRD